MGDVNMVRDVLFTAWMTVLGRGAVLFGTAIILFFIDPVVALVALAPLPFLFFSIQKSTRRLKKVSEKQRKKEGAVASYAAESLSRIAVIKAFAAEERSTNEFSKMVRGSEKAELESKRISAGMGRKAEALSGFGLATVLCVAAHRALRGILLPGDLIVALSYTRALYKPLRKISTDGARLGKAAACAHRLIEILELPPEEDTGGEDAPRFAGEIRLEDLHLDYPNGRKALRGVSFQVPAGSLVHVLGKNGAGKSTLLAVLLRLRRPDKGRVLVDGRDVETFGISGYRDRIAFVPQRLQLFSGTVKENILYGRPSATDEDVLAAARAALCDDFVNDLPDGYETVLGEGGTRLSGGEARRIMLARAALRDARILLLDEPLAGLDPVARATVGRALSIIAEGRTTLVVHHGDGIELSADLVIRMEAGRASVLAGPKAGTKARA
jgi:ATP-binding cassette subfamily B protein